MKIQLNKIYKTFGNWDAKVIYICSSGFYAIHKPMDKEESTPIFHLSSGRALPSLAVNEPPTYGENHPADIIINTKGKTKGGVSETNI